MFCNSFSYAISNCVAIDTDTSPWWTLELQMWRGKTEISGSLPEYESHV